MASTVTPSFIEGIIQDGRLTEARLRYEAGGSNPSSWDLKTQSCWSLICEEVIDTDHEPDEYDAVYAELIQRGFNPTDIDEMRRFAWKTAGWLNYDMMLWDWVNLDENDIRKALEWQFEKKTITQGNFEEGLQMIERYIERDSLRKK